MEYSPWKDPPPDILVLESLAAEPHKSALGAYWATVQLMNHLFADISCYDPLTGQTTPQSLLKTLSSLANLLGKGERPFPEDSVYRTAEFCLEPLEYILQTPRKKLIRQHLLLPLYKIREMDTHCMAYFAKQPGRNAKEKIALKDHALGVQREISADTLENQIVKRLLLDLKPLLLQRIDFAHHYDDSEGNYEKRKILEKMYALCTSGLKSSFLQSVSPATTLKPNNVLLSDRGYNKIWRTMQWFHKYRQEVIHLWEAGPSRLVISAFWSLVTRLWCLVDLLLPDTVCLSHPGFFGESFGITLLQKSTSGATWQNDQSPYLDFVVPGEHGALLISMAVQEGKILIEIGNLEREYSPGWQLWKFGTHDPIQYEVNVIFDALELREQNRYFPWKAWIMRNHKNATTITKDYADLAGFYNFGTRVWSYIFRDMRRELYLDRQQSNQTTEPIQIQTSLLVGLDLSGACPRWVSNQEFCNSSIPLYAVPYTLPDNTQDWLVGQKTSLLIDQEHWPNVISLSSVLEEREQNEENLCSSGLQQISASLSKQLSLLPHSQLAIAIPDTLDELAFQLARSTLTPLCDKLYFLWRSVAGVLGWQTMPAFRNINIQAGDVVVVMDAEAPSWTATCLVARYDRRLDDSPARGLYWERKPSLSPLSEGDDLSFHGLLEDYLRLNLGSVAQEQKSSKVSSQDLNDQFEDMIEHLITTGLAEQLIENGEPIWIALPPEIAANLQAQDEGDVGWLKLTFDREIWKEATQSWYSRFKDWLYNWKYSEQIHEIRQYAGSHTIHLLFIGRPFHHKWLREIILYYLGKHFDGLYAKYHILENSNEVVARGATSFLERTAQNLPTYEDWLPDLYLQVLDNGIPNFIQIFEGRTAHPGQEIFYDVPNTLELPASQPSYRIPLVRDRNSRRPMLYAARLESPAFPLRRPLTVTMRVWYRYGEDSYRLLVSPKDSSNTAFKEIEVKWVRGAESNEEQRQNLAPNFPAQESWDRHELRQYSQWFLEAANDLNREAKQIFSGNFFIHHSSEYVRRYMENFGRLLEKKLLPPCKRLLHYSKNHTEIDEEVFTALREDVIPWLTRLAGLDSEEHESLTAPPYLSPILDRIRQVSIEVLSLLGPEIPSSFLLYLKGKFQDPSQDREVCYMFGRVIGAGESERRELVRALLHELRRRFEENLRRDYDDSRGPVERNKVGYRYLLWALATALWRHSDFLYTLRDLSVIRFLLKLIHHDCRSLLYTLQKPGLSPKYQLNSLSYFRSIVEILLGILRLRNDEHDSLLQSGNRRLTELAYYLHQIDAQFLKIGYHCKSCFKFECVQRHEGMSEIVHVVTSYLTGEQHSGLIKIKKIEQEFSDEEENVSDTARVDWRS